MTDGFSKITGWKHEDLKGASAWIGLVHPNDRQQVYKLYRQLLENRSIRAEIRLVTRSGETRWVEADARPVWDSGAHRVTGCYLLLEDITRARSAESDLVEKTAEMNEMLASVEVLVFSYDTQSRQITYVSPSCEEITGVPGTTLMGRPSSWRKFIHPDDLIALVNLHRAAPCGVPVDVEFRIVRPDGELRWLRGKFNFRPGPHGTIAATHGFMVNITERKLAELALESSAAEMKAIFASMNDLILVMNREGRYLKAINGQKTMLTLPASEVIGKTPYDLLPYSAAAFIHEQVIRAIDTGEQVHFDYQLEIGGTGRWFSASASAYSNDRAVVVSREITERKSVEEMLAYRALHDSLTGLPNRDHFLEKLSSLIQHPSPNMRGTWAVILLNLDRFKAINATVGHDQGNCYLVSLTNRLRERIREGDLLARMNGDEFAVLLRGLRSPDDVHQAVWRIQQAVQEPIEINGLELFTTASIGVALGVGNYSNSDETIRDAQTALFRARIIGSGRYEVFDTRMHTQTMQVMRLQSDLRRAVDRHEFVLHYQPIASLCSHKVSSAEALVRWNHPERGLLGPGEFIAVAEENALILPIGNWVLRAAADQARAWYESGRPDMCVAVNISARQLYDQYLPLYIRQVLQETGLPASNLQIELTETIAMQDIRRAIEIMTDISELGVQISLDDFGTGYSSLSYLKHFPLDTLKIDRSFVQNIATSEVDATIISSIIQMAHALHIEVVAEGVETTAQLEVLRSLDCDHVQGYVIARPCEARAFHFSAGDRLFDHPASRGTA